MPRTMVMWAPDWPIVAAELSPSMPAAVLDKGHVLACSQSARAEGVRRGMRRRDAQSRCPGLVLHDYNPDADARGFEAVLTAIEELSPGVAPLRPGLCALRVPSRFYGGEAEAAAVIAERLVGIGVWDVRIGIADGLFAAELAARRALAQDSLAIPPGGSAHFLHDLPIDALDDPDLVGLLRRMGLLTLGDFAGLPAADVHTRFGTHGELLHRLARGLDPQPVSRRQVPPEFDATLTLEPPLELIEPIAFSLRTTAEGFVTDLAAHGLVCTTVLIEVDADGSLATARRWMHPRWFGATDLIDRLRWQLQADGAVRAPVDAVRLIPEVTEPLGDHADSLFGGGPDERVERGVARVQSIVGHESVVSASVQGGR
ncbi:MAG: polymerase, partial [Aeromicrobium sp.]|nr:polymerase [Aeromicrobium sp.]